MEWLLAHADDPEPIPGHIVGENQPQSSSEPPGAAADTQSKEAAEEEAKSFKCDECGKLFKNQDEMEFHAAKTNHSSFSESTEEKKPLTEEEKKAQLALLEERMKQKRKEREEREKVFRFHTFYSPRCIFVRKYINHICYCILNILTKLVWISFF